MTQLIINKEAKVNAQGKVNHKNAKPVFCMNTGIIYASVIDAAECTSSDAGDISRCCNGKVRHVKGSKYIFVNDIQSHLDELSNTIAKCNNIIAEREAEELRKREEERKQMEAKKRQETIAKLKDRLARETDKQVKTQTRIEALNAEIKSLESMLM